MNIIKKFNQKKYLIMLNTILLFLVTRLEIIKKKHFCLSQIQFLNSD